ncbi:hypothetical protein [Halomicrococcus gelatinilyticus]|uniref:hypothetical protein n=1 Tax=Halomicrococcus gelatinilyticus TaxID=1702103 RepID=UPI002E131528
MQPTFVSHPDRNGIEVVDPVESARFALYTGTPVDPTPADPDAFYFPVDHAVGVEARRIEIPKLGNVFVRRRDGSLVADNTDRTDLALPVDDYLLELTTAPMKLYLAVESRLAFEHTDDAVVVSFDAPSTVRVGARSFHDRPAGTVTVTDDPTDVLRAMSLFGSALKTTSPERAFPTHRGHPPLVERGDAFEVPDGLARPDTGIELVVPPEYEYVYPAAPLAYYLGAAVVPGDSPRIVADGFEYPLAEYEDAVHRVLRQTFFLDCLTRTEGHYEVDLHERRQVEPHLDLDFAALYDASPAERLVAYLGVPYATVADYVPEWNLTTHVMPRPEHVGVLPFVADDLALVRCPPSPTEASVEPTLDAQAEFLRTDPAEFTRSTDDTDVIEADLDDVFQPTAVDTVEHAWVGDGYPLGANKTTPDARRRRLQRDNSDSTDISVHVVCNDEQMRDEDVVADHYGDRDMLSFDVDVHYDCSVAELRDLLETPANFLHYIGHVDDEGIHCADGHLDAGTLESVGVEAFLLNACRSYEQGEALVDAGSFGGVVTLSDVANCIATKLGRPLARLLNYGFSLRVALAIARDQVLTGFRYGTIGDGGLTLVQNESGLVVYTKVRRLESDKFELQPIAYPTGKYGLGSMMTLTYYESDVQYISSGALDEVVLDRSEFEEFLDDGVFPVEVDGELRWSDALTPSDV